MEKPRKLLAVVVAYNTDMNTKTVLERFPEEREFDVLVVNDGSTDKTKEYLHNSGFQVVHHPENKGVGAAIKTGIRHAIDNDYYALAILAGNNKDDPNEIMKLFHPIVNKGYDYVQGSRFLKGGKWDNLPLFRYVMIKAHAMVFFVLTGFRGTDALNGFRAYKTSIFRDKKINVWQSWLDRYQLETYLHYGVIKYGYKVTETPVSKIYPSKKGVKYSHIRPFIDWWKILSPIFFLLFRIKR